MNMYQVKVFKIFFIARSGKKNIMFSIGKDGREALDKAHENNKRFQPDRAKYFVAM